MTGDRATGVLLTSRQRNVPASGAGDVTRFDVGTELPARHPVRRADGRTIPELRLPAEELAESNRHSVGPIKAVHVCRAEP